MKKCDYCGGENSEEATHCEKCGTDEFGAAIPTPMTFQKIGLFIRLTGWVIFILSIFFALSNKSADPPNVLIFWLSFGILVGVSLVYGIGRTTSERWGSKAVRSYFSPYIVGTTCWLLLFLIFYILDKILNK